MEYFKRWECPKCDAEIFRKGLNFEERNGCPVFDVSMFESEYITCDNEIYRSNEDEDEFISKEEWLKLSEEEQDKYYYDECGCEFGTGDIEIVEV